MLLFSLKYEFSLHTLGVFRAQPLSFVGNNLVRDGTSTVGCIMRIARSSGACAVHVPEMWLQTQACPFLETRFRLALFARAQNGS